MARSRGGRGFVERLEDRVDELVSRHDRVSLAYSGGLASTLLALVARKRCDLICFVAGTSESPDVRAANTAKLHFDLRVESIILNRATVRKHVQDVRASNRSLSMDSVRMLVPLHAVVQENPGSMVLSGFGHSPTGLSIQRSLHAQHVVAPLLGIRIGRTLL